MSFTEKRAAQSMAAAACEVKLKTFQSWIRKYYYPTILGGYNLASFLDVSVEYLVTGKEASTKDLIEKARTLLKEADEKLKAIRK
jgi:hypothetical protein